MAEKIHVLSRLKNNYNYYLSLKDPTIDTSIYVYHNTLKHFFFLPKFLGKIATWKKNRREENMP